MMIAQHLTTAMTLSLKISFSYFDPIKVSQMILWHWTSKS